MSPVEQYTIDCEYLAYFEPKKKEKKIRIFFYKRDIMQLFSADGTMFLKKFKHFFAHENMKKSPQKLLIIGPNFFFQYCQPVQNQPKSHFVFHKNVSLHNFYIMTLSPALISPLTDKVML